MLRYPSSHQRPWGVAGGMQRPGQPPLPVLTESPRQEFTSSSPARGEPSLRNSPLPARRSCLACRHQGLLRVPTTAGSWSPQSPARVIPARNSTAANSKTKSQSCLLRGVLVTECRKPEKTFFSCSPKEMEMIHTCFINAIKYTSAMKGTHFQGKFKYQLPSHLPRKVSTTGDTTKVNQRNARELGQQAQ